MSAGPIPYADSGSEKGWIITVCFIPRRSAAARAGVLSAGATKRLERVLDSVVPPLPREFCWYAFAMFSTAMRTKPAGRGLRRAAVTDIARPD